MMRKRLFHRPPRVDAVETRCAFKEHPQSFADPAIVFDEHDRYGRRLQTVHHRANTRTPPPQNGEESERSDDRDHRSLAGGGTQLRRAAEPCSPPAYVRQTIAVLARGAVKTAAVVTHTQLQTPGVQPKVYAGLRGTGMPRDIIDRFFGNQK